MHDANFETAERPDYMRPLRARWWLIVLIGLVAAVGTYHHYASKPVAYQAQTSLYMKPDSATQLLNGNTGGPGDPNYLANQAVLAHTPGVAVEAARLLGYKGDPGMLLGEVSIAPSSGSDFLQVTASSANPVDAGRVANAFAQAYVDTQKRSEQQLAASSVNSLRQQLAAVPNDVAHAAQRSQLVDQIGQLQLFENVPTAPAVQVNPAGLGAPVASNPKSHAIYGLVLGLVIGAALAYAVDALSRRVKRLEDVEALYGVPVIAKVPSAPARVAVADPRDGLQAPIDEPFRALRTALQLRAGSEHGPGHLRTIMVASAAPGDGKSTVVRNLALAYLEAGQRVAVVDCDLRRPEVSRRFKVGAKPGLPEVLTGNAMTSDALRVIDVAGSEMAVMARGIDLRLETTAAPSHGLDGGLIGAATRESVTAAQPPELAVLPSSSPSWNPAAIFAAGRFEAVLSGLKSQYDVVILDTSPLAAVSDAAALLPMVDGVLLVSRVRRTSTSSIEELKHVLEAVPQANLLGVVANDVPSRNTPYAYSRAYSADA